MAIYDQLYAFANGALLVENTSLDIKLDSEDTQVKSIAKGFSGISPGAPIVMITIKSNVPISGPEYDFADSLLSKVPIEFKAQYGGSGLSLTVKEAYVVGPLSISTAIGKATEEDIVIVGKAPYPFWS